MVSAIFWLSGLLTVRAFSMPADIIYSPGVLLFLFACLALLVLVLCSALLGQQLTKPVVIAVGLAFIGVGVLGHVSVLDMEARGKELLAGNLLSPHVFAQFSRYRDVFAYFFPAISAAVGTNVISDALLKHHTYEREFSFLQFAKDILFALSLPVGLLVGGIASLLWVVSLPVAPARRYFGTTVPRIWRWTQLKALKVSIVARYAVRKKL